MKTIEIYMGVDKASPGKDVQSTQMVWMDQLQKYRDNKKCYDCGMYFADPTYCYQCENHKNITGE